MIDETDAMTVSLDAIFHELERIGHPTAKHRKPGIAGYAVEKGLARLGLDAPAQLLALYRYSDGTDDPEAALMSEVYLFPGYYWPSFSEAGMEYAELLQTEGWDRSWFPIFANGGGDYYIVVCDADSSSFGEVARVMKERSGVVAEYRDLASFMSINARCYELGVYLIVDGLLQCDYDRRREIARELQPGFEPKVIGQPL